MEKIDQYEPNQYSRLNLNSTGEKIVVPIAGERTDIYVLDTVRGSSTQLTTKGINWWPIWSPDDESIIFEKYSREGVRHRITQVKPLALALKGHYSKANHQSARMIGPATDQRSLLLNGQNKSVILI
ncbi:MAG: hypothetical protein Ct9H300mP7_7140 [Verrucomicrobiota bacterium]|nr:MAG: hypothetical protein Ct9H300mP7_7140 [Verrucomicrobiota bacterium]